MEARSSRNRLPATSPSVEPDHGPRNAAILSFATVIVLLLVVYVALFDVDSTAQFKRA
jgi:hypothetical protein